MSDTTTEQRHQAALDLWREREASNEAPPSLAELIQAAYPDRSDLDGRTKEARELKSFLSELEIQADGSHVYHPKEIESLTDEQKEFIDNNAGTMGGTHLGRVMHDDPSITPLDGRVRQINEYIATLPQHVVSQNTDISTNPILIKHYSWSTSTFTKK